MQISPDTSTRTIVASGFVVNVPEPFTEGHVLTAAEAVALNQTFAENIRNGIRTKLTAEGVDAQAVTDEYVAVYEFGARRGGSTGPRKSTDPVEDEARKLAGNAVKAGIKQKGIALKEVDPADLDRMISEALEKYPQIREKAAQIVSLRNGLALDAL